MDIRVNKKYKLLKKIGGGAFGEVYSAENTITGEAVAVKLEPANTKSSQLSNENRVYHDMRGSVGVPHVYWYGREGDYNVLVFDLLGKSLQELFVECGRKISLHTVLMFAVQAIARLQYLHLKGFLHRDIKPENFVVGNKESNTMNTIYIIDFGISSLYIDRRTGKHVEYSEGNSLSGTARYVSINTHLGIEPSRRDDMEALAYVLIYLLKGSLPWEGIKSQTKEDKYEKILQKKKSTPTDVLCKDLPIEFQLFLDDVRRLDFEEEPHYSYYRSLFFDLMVKEGFFYDYKFDWYDASHYVGPCSPGSIFSCSLTSPSSKYEQLNSNCRCRSRSQVKEQLSHGSIPHPFPEPVQKLSAINLKPDPQTWQVRRVKLRPMCPVQVIKPSIRAKPGI